jgi:hypothetical protein
MAKAFVELKYRQRKYKLNADDISKVYRFHKRSIPSLPVFDPTDKIQAETDDDCEPTVEIRL